MNFSEFLLQEKIIKDFHVITLSNTQSLTNDEKSFLEFLLTQFKSVNVGLSVDQDLSSVNDRKKIIKKEIPNLRVEKIDKNMICGVYLNENNTEIRRIFRIKDNSPIVIAVKKEDQVYKMLSKRKDVHNLNIGDNPISKNDVGLFRI